MYSENVPLLAPSPWGKHFNTKNLLQQTKIFTTYLLGQIPGSSHPWVLDILCKNVVKQWQKSLFAGLVCNSHFGYNSWECELELLSVSVWRMRFYLYSGWACCVRDCCSNCILHLGTNCERSAPHPTRGPPALCSAPKYSSDNIAWFTLNSSLQTTRYPTNDDVKAASCSVALVAFYLAHCALFNILIGDWAGAGG